MEIAVGLCHVNIVFDGDGPGGEVVESDWGGGG